MAPQSRGRTASSYSALQHTPPSLAEIQILHLRPSTTETTPDEAASAQTLGDSTHAPMSSSASVDGDVDEAEEGEEGEEEDDDADFQSHYSLDAAPSSSISSSSSESDHGHDNESSSGGGGDQQRTTTPSFLHHSSSPSLPFSNSFAPPFYNRPPTPLPPSPSLTSLLRPSFSTNTSRPTTPDTSDNDTPNDTEAAVAKSARIATTVPRASPKVPTYEYYGFVLYLLSSLAFRTFTSPPCLVWNFFRENFVFS